MPNNELTFKEILNNAIQGFNGIQNSIGFVTGNLNVVKVNGSTTTVPTAADSGNTSDSMLSVEEMVALIKNLAIIDTTNIAATGNSHPGFGADASTISNIIGNKTFINGKIRYVDADISASQDAVMTFGGLNTSQPSINIQQAIPEGYYRAADPSNNIDPIYYNGTLNVDKATFSVTPISINIPATDMGINSDTHVPAEDDYNGISNYSTRYTNLTYRPAGTAASINAATGVGTIMRGSDLSTISSSMVSNEDDRHIYYLKFRPAAFSLSTGHAQGDTFSDGTVVTSRTGLTYAGDVEAGDPPDTTYVGATVGYGASSDGYDANSFYLPILEAKVTSTINENGASFSISSPGYITSGSLGNVGNAVYGTWVPGASVNGAGDGWTHGSISASGGNINIVSENSTIGATLLNEQPQSGYYIRLNNPAIAPASSGVEAAIYTATIASGYTPINSGLGNSYNNVTSVSYDNINNANFGGIRSYIDVGKLEANRYLLLNSATFNSSSSRTVNQSQSSQDFNGLQNIGFSANNITVQSSPENISSTSYPYVININSESKFNATSAGWVEPKLATQASPADYIAHTTDSMYIGLAAADGATSLRMANNKLSYSSDNSATSAYGLISPNYFNLISGSSESRTVSGTTYKALNIEQLSTVSNPILDHSSTYTKNEGESNQQIFTTAGEVFNTDPAYRYFIKLKSLSEDKNYVNITASSAITSAGWANTTPNNASFGTSAGSSNYYYYQLDDSGNKYISLKAGSIDIKTELTPANPLVQASVNDSENNQPTLQLLGYESVGTTTGNSGVIDTNNTSGNIWVGVKARIYNSYTNVGYNKHAGVISNYDGLDNGDIIAKPQAEATYTNEKYINRVDPYALESTEGITLPDSVKDKIAARVMVAPVVKAATEGTNAYDSTTGRVGYTRQLATPTKATLYDSNDDAIGSDVMIKIFLHTQNLLAQASNTSPYFVNNTTDGVSNSLVMANNVISSNAYIKKSVLTDSNSSIAPSQTFGIMRYIGGSGNENTYPNTYLTNADIALTSLEYNAISGDALDDAANVIRIGTSQTAYSKLSTYGWRISASPMTINSKSYYAITPNETFGTIYPYTTIEVTENGQTRVLDSLTASGGYKGDIKSPFTGTFGAALGLSSGWFDAPNGNATGTGNTVSRNASSIINSSSLSAFSIKIPDSGALKEVPRYITGQNGQQENGEFNTLSGRVTFTDATKALRAYPGRFIVINKGYFPDDRFVYVPTSASSSNAQDDTETYKLGIFFNQPTNEGSVTYTGDNTGMIRPKGVMDSSTGLYHYPVIYTVSDDNGNDKISLQKVETVTTGSGNNAVTTTKVFRAGAPKTYNSSGGVETTYTADDISGWFNPTIQTYFSAANAPDFYHLQTADDNIHSVGVERGLPIGNIPQAALSINLGEIDSNNSTLNSSVLGSNLSIEYLNLSTEAPTVANGYYYIKLGDPSLYFQTGSYGMVTASSGSVVDSTVTTEVDARKRASNAETVTSMCEIKNDTLTYHGGDHKTPIIKIPKATVTINADADGDITKIIGAGGEAPFDGHQGASDTNAAAYGISLNPSESDQNGGSLAVITVPHIVQIPRITVKASVANNSKGIIGTISNADNPIVFNGTAGSSWSYDQTNVFPSGENSVSQKLGLSGNRQVDLGNTVLGINKFVVPLSTVAAGTVAVNTTTGMSIDSTTTDSSLWNLSYNSTTDSSTYYSLTLNVPLTYTNSFVIPAGITKGGTQPISASADLKPVIGIKRGSVVITPASHTAETVTITNATPAGSYYDPTSKLSVTESSSDGSSIVFASSNGTSGLSIQPSISAFQLTADTVTVESGLISEDPANGEITGTWGSHAQNAGGSEVFTLKPKIIKNANGTAQTISDITIGDGKTLNSVTLKGNNGSSSTYNINILDLQGTTSGNTTHGATIQHLAMGLGSKIENVYGGALPDPIANPFITGLSYRTTTENSQTINHLDIDTIENGRLKVGLLKSGTVLELPTTVFKTNNNDTAACGEVIATGDYTVIDLSRTANDSELRLNRDSSSTKHVQIDTNSSDTVAVGPAIRFNAGYATYRLDGIYAEGSINNIDLGNFESGTTYKINNLGSILEVRHNSGGLDNIATSEILIPADTTFPKVNMGTGGQITNIEMNANTASTTRIGTISRTGGNIDHAYIDNINNITINGLGYVGNTNGTVNINDARGTVSIKKISANSGANTVKLPFAKDASNNNVYASSLANTGGSAHGEGWVIVKDNPGTGPLVELHGDTHANSPALNGVESTGTISSFDNKGIITSFTNTTSGVSSITSFNNSEHIGTLTNSGDIDTLTGSGTIDDFTMTGGIGNDGASTWTESNSRTTTNLYGKRVISTLYGTLDINAFGTAGKIIVDVRNKSSLPNNKNDLIVVKDGNMVLANLHNGFVTTDSNKPNNGAGWVDTSASTSIYSTEYNSTYGCVDFYFV